MCGTPSEESRSPVFTCMRNVRELTGVTVVPALPRPFGIQAFLRFERACAPRVRVLADFQHTTFVNVE